MITFIWALTFVLFIISLSWLLAYLTNDSKSSDSFTTLTKGIKEGLKGCGLFLDSSSYPIERYRWTITQEGPVCDDCLQKTTWPAMDLADWMDSDLPYQPDENARCQGNCRCELTLEKSNPLKSHYNQG